VIPTGPASPEEEAKVIAKTALEALLTRGDIDGAYVLVIRKGARGAAIISPALPLDALIGAAAESLDELYTLATEPKTEPPGPETPGEVEGTPPENP
jgi:hypothetical protein